MVVKSKLICSKHLSGAALSFDRGNNIFQNNCFEMRAFFQRSQCALCAKTAMFVTTKRHFVGSEETSSIDHSGSSLHRIGHGHCRSGIFGKNAAIETIYRLICNANGFLHCVKTNNRNDRPKDFIILCNICCCRNVGYHGNFIERSAAMSTHQNFPALFNDALYLRLYLLGSILVDDRTNLNGRIHRITAPNLL